MRVVFTATCLAIMGLSIAGVLWISPSAEEFPASRPYVSAASGADRASEAPPPAEAPPVAAEPDNQPAPAEPPPPPPAAPHPKRAEPLDRPGLPNLHRVSQDLYRGAQPTTEGMKELKKLGVRTVINLRSFHSDRDEIGETGLAYERLYVKPWHPEEKEIIRFLQIVTDKNRAPVFVHCQHGADRTGTLCAVYRIVVQGWSKEDAIEEMRHGGYNFHEVWKNLPRFLQQLDVPKIRARVFPPSAAPREGQGED